MNRDRVSLVFTSRPSAY